MGIFLIILGCAVAITIGVLLISYSKKAADEEAKGLIDEVVKKVEPLFKEQALAYWNATTTGETKWYKEAEDAEVEYTKVLSDRDVYEKLKGLRRRDFDDPTIKRQVNVLYREFLENQIPGELNEEMIRQKTAIVEKFNNYRAKVGEKTLTNNDIREVLKKSLDSGERRAVWEASKQVGNEIAQELVQLVKLRNKAARLVGFENYYDLHLFGQEFTEEELNGIFATLADVTDQPFKGLKTEIDSLLAGRYGLGIGDLRPWHYEDAFFQEVPSVYNVKLDELFKGKNVVDIVEKYFGSIGLDVSDILKRSDLFERAGKDQHAYCTDIDKKGDVRVLANVKDNEQWTGTMLHELGHAVYDKYQLPTTPYLLREAAHIFTTEGVAEMFGRLVYYSEWLHAALGEDVKQAVEEYRDRLHNLLRAQMLIFARWCLVMVNFEKGLYKKPEQDLNALWWDLVEKYQLVNAPNARSNPDWAAKTHLSSAPVYYHNYILGEMFVSQMESFLRKNVTAGAFPFVDNDKFGIYLKEKVFAPGATLRWNEFVKEVTGEDLTPKYFADQFAG